MQPGATAGQSLPVVDLDHRSGWTATCDHPDQLCAIRSSTAANAHPYRMVTHGGLRNRNEIVHNLRRLACTDPRCHTAAPGAGAAGTGIGVGPDVDAPTGQPGGQAGVLALLPIASESW